MNDRATPSDPDIIRAFLQDSHSKRTLYPFTQLCQREITLYLKKLQTYGWRLPFELVQAEKPHHDLAIMIITEMMRPAPDGRFFWVIHEYFVRHEIDEPWDLDDESLLRQFRIITRGFARKEVTILRKLENPQIHNLKRSIRDNLDSSEYGTGSVMDVAGVQIWRQENANNLRPDRPIVSRDLLLDIVIRAFSDSLNRAQWCQKIFALLDRMIEHRNSLPLHDLISAMVEVNAGFVETGGIIPGQMPSPYEEHRRNELQKAEAAVKVYIANSVIKSFVAKGRLTEDEAKEVVTACNNFLEDLCSKGETDSKPSYFLALRPEVSQKEYQERYKAPIDGVFDKALSKLRQILRDNPTIWFDRDY